MPDSAMSPTLQSQALLRHYIPAFKKLSFKLLLHKKENLEKLMYEKIPTIKL
jgi:hypothetical protein